MYILTHIRHENFLCTARGDHPVVRTSVFINLLQLCLERALRNELLIPVVDGQRGSRVLDTVMRDALDLLAQKIPRQETKANFPKQRKRKRQRSPQESRQTNR